MEPDGHVVLLEPEQVGQFLIRQPLDVAQQEQRRIVALEGGDGAPELFFQQPCRLDGGMRRPIVVSRFSADCSAAEQVDGGVDGGAPEIGGRPLRGLVLLARGDHAEEHGLQDVLGVSRASGDPEGCAVHRLGVPLIQSGEIRQPRRGSHLDAVAHLRAGSGHVVRLTRIDARAGRVLHREEASVGKKGGPRATTFGMSTSSVPCSRSDFAGAIPRCSTR